MVMGGGLASGSYLDVHEATVGVNNAEQAPHMARHVILSTRPRTLARGGTQPTRSSDEARAQNPHPPGRHGPGYAPPVQQAKHARSRLPRPRHHSTLAATPAMALARCPCPHATTHAR